MFKLRLALALGKTLTELNRWLDENPQELSWWLAYNRIEPIPEPWLQTGVTCSTLAKVFGGNAKVKATDFMPVVERKKRKRQDSKSLKATMGMWIKAQEQVMKQQAASK